MYCEVGAFSPMVITIRPAVSEDADAIARTFLESAEYHARLDPERYLIPALETVSTRYRERRQHPANGCGEGRITLVAERGREIVGFIDVRLEGSPDPMHRRILYCHLAEIAVSERYQSQGIGGQLLRAAEEWGRQHNAHFGSLEYHVANTRAGKRYQDCGYSIAASLAIKRLRE
jgi:GNAT superfamily N-acetyltransferase